MLGRFRSAIYSAIGTEIESGTPAVPGSGSVDAGRVGKVSENMSSYKRINIEVNLICLNAEASTLINNIYICSLLKMPLVVH